MKITVLMGGTSSERNVSLASGIRIVQALRERGHQVTALDPARGVISASEERELSKKKWGPKHHRSNHYLRWQRGHFSPTSLR